MIENRNLIYPLVDEDASKENTIDSYLSFKLDDELFAVDVQRVSEILEVPSITKIPKAPGYLAGIVNLRGRVLPLVDAKIKFELEAVEFTVDTCIIVIDIAVEGEIIQTGILVDSVLEVLEIDKENIQPSPVIDARYNLKFIEGMFKQGDDFIMLLNLNEVFSLKDVEYMKSADKEEKSKKPKKASRVRKEAELVD